MSRDSTLTPIELARVAAGALFLQATFTPERQQALGVAAALAPLAPRFRDPEKRARFLKRHLEYFNTNPAMAGFILGAVARLEGEAAAGNETAEARVPKLKKGLEGPFAAAGDALIWNGARPAAGLAGSAAALVVGSAGPWVFLVLFNVVHLGLRVGGVFGGYHRGETVHRMLRARGWRALLAVVPWAVLAGGLLLGLAAFGPQRSLGPVVLGLAGALLGILWERRGIARGVPPAGRL